jgi:S-formylglutathione hydrolase FrmB
LSRTASRVAASLSLALLLPVSLAGPVSSDTHAPATMFPGCAPPSSSLPVVTGRVTCQLMESRDIGGITAFSYYVPPACAPALHRLCPVLYLLHGFGGDYTDVLGTGDHPSAWVEALTSGPSIDPHTVGDPWDYSDPAQWVSRSPLGVILVAPDGRTLQHGFGPMPGLDGFWADWNPRYARGGDAPRYATPPPRFESSLIDELMPVVEARFPTLAGRDWRALAGTSLGGYGSYLIGLHHPDLFSSIGSVSGAFNFFFAPGIDPLQQPLPGGVQPPLPIPYRAVPGPISFVPFNAVPAPAQDFAVATLVLGDPSTDQAYFRGNMPRDLAMNARARAGPVQSLIVRYFSNDAVPRRTGDVQSPPDYLVAQAFEGIVLGMNQDMRAAFTDEAVDQHYELHPGLHSGIYWDAWLRGQLEAQYEHLHHWDGSGAPLPMPQTFDYRSIGTDISIWGWHFAVQRVPVEFLTLRHVSCRTLTLQGTGIVDITAPPACGTGVRGARAFRVDLGPSMPVDEPGGISGTGAYGRSVTVALTPLSR